MRRYNKSDARGLASLLCNPEVQKWTQEDPLPFKDVEKLMVKTLSDNRIIVLGNNPKTEAVMFSPFQWTTFTAHIVLHPDNRGAEAMKMVKEAAGIMFTKTTCKTILAFVAVDHKACCKFVTIVGMKHIGKTEGTFLRNNEMIDENIYQVTLEQYRRL